MAKKQIKQKNPAPLSTEEVANYKPENPLDKLNLIMGVDLGTIFNQGVTSGAVVVKPSTGSTNMSDSLIPKPQKTTRKKK